MKRFISAALLGICSIANWAIAASASPCAVAEKELEFSYSYLEPSAVKLLKSCTSSNSVCVLTFEGKVLRGANSKDLSKEPPGAMFALLQLNDACLMAQYSGGSAAAWMFDGWRTNTGKAVPVKGFDKIRLNSDGVFPAGVVDLMQSKYKRLSSSRK